MTRAEVFAACPGLDESDIETTRGIWRWRVVDSPLEELSARDDLVDITVDYSGPELGQLRLHINPENLNARSVRDYLTDMFGRDPLPLGHIAL